jgi:hypothetical protein
VVVSRTTHDDASAASAAQQTARLGAECAEAPDRLYEKSSTQLSIEEV